jgi:hypothetical protein
MSRNLGVNGKGTSSVTHFGAISMLVKTDLCQILQHSLQPVWQLGWEQLYVSN